MSYGIGHVGTWLAWRLMAETNAAVAANLRAVIPDATDEALRRHALKTYRSYACDTIDFLRALSAGDRELLTTFDIRPEDRATFEGVLARGKGGLMVTGHYGNWEIGGLLMRVLDLPLTVVAMAESDPEVNRLRRETRARMGVDTLEVRQSLETALQIRRHARSEPPRRDADRSASWARSRAGHAPWTAGLLPADSGAAGLPERRAADSLLSRADRAGALQNVCRGARLRRSAVAARAAMQQATQRVADVIESRVRLNPHAWYHFYRYWDAQRGILHGLD